MFKIIKSKAHQTSRFGDLDLLRGIAILAMIVFHFTFDLAYFGLIAADTIYRPGWILFQQTIAGTFIFVAGVGFDLCHGRGIRWGYVKKRILVLGTLSLLISLVTYVIFGPFWIKFGILHCILACSLIALSAVRLSTLMLGALTGLLFILYYYLDPPMNIPNTYDFLIRTIHPHYSVDYRPIFPWLVVFFAGMVSARFIWRPSGGFGEKFSTGILRYRLLNYICYLGRNSLLIYIIHQPILFSALFLLLFMIQ